MSNDATPSRDASLARQLAQLDSMGMSIAERERAKAYLRRAEAVVDLTARLWIAAGAYARRVRASGTRRAAAVR